MEKRTNLYGEGDFDGIDKLEKELACSECRAQRLGMHRRADENHKRLEKRLYLHCLPADITGVSCETGEVDASVFDRYRIPLYKEASFKPYVIAAMIMLSKFENPAGHPEKAGSESSSQNHGIIPRWGVGGLYVSEKTNRNRSWR